MARTPSSKDGRPRVHLSATISAKAHDMLMKTSAQLKSKNPKAHIGQAIDSIADFAEARKFDPIKIQRPAKASTPSPARSATPSAIKV
jgi:hypothetical protein